MVASLRSAGDRRLRVPEEPVVTRLLRRQRRALLRDLILQAGHLGGLSLRERDVRRRFVPYRADLVRELHVLAVDDHHRLDPARELGERVGREEHLERGDLGLAVRRPEMLRVEVLALRQLLVLSVDPRFQR